VPFVKVFRWLSGGLIEFPIVRSYKRFHNDHKLPKPESDCSYNHCKSKYFQNRVVFQRQAVENLIFFVKKI